MRIRFVVIGKPAKELRLAIEDIEKRLPTYCTFDVVEVKTEKFALEKIIGTCVVLDIKGKQFSSEEFSLWLKEENRITFCIGGPEGFSERIKERAQLLLSLSTMTLPHILARLVLAEQIYRAFTIITGKKYHR